MPSPRRFVPFVAAAGLVASAFLTSAGCSDNKPAAKDIPRYPTIGLKKVPPYFKDTILENTDVTDIGDFYVTGYGLVTKLQDTGGGPYPTAVREFMIKEILKHGFGRATMPEYREISADGAMNSPTNTIVEVTGLMPPGIRKGQTFDVGVQCLGSSDATSLARGHLYEAELHVLGNSETDPSGAITTYSRVAGPVFVNPAYAFRDGGNAPTIDMTHRQDRPTTEPTALTRDGAKRESLRNGIIMDGGWSEIDRPIRLQLRQPQRSVSRQIEFRINTRYQGEGDYTIARGYGAMQVCATAQDEGIVSLYVPKSFNGDWAHFLGVVQHLYRNATSEYSGRKARELADVAASQPDAPLADISYAWEGLGKPALPFILPLMDSTKYGGEVNFAAARAAAFLDDPTASSALVQMAQTAGHPEQLPAVHVLGQLPATPRVDGMIRSLLNSPNSLVRIEAYTILSGHGDSSIYTRIVGEKFALDIIAGDGPPIIYATRRGLPRIAIFGNRVSLNLPVLFTSMNDKFSVSSPSASDVVDGRVAPSVTPTGRVILFYRGPELAHPVQVVSNPDIGEIIARLGGEGAPGSDRFNFEYGDIVGLVQSMADKGLLTASYGEGGERLAASFMLQQAPRAHDAAQQAPQIPGTDPDQPTPAAATTGAAGGEQSRAD